MYHGRSSRPKAGSRNQHETAGRNSRPSSTVRVEAQRRSRADRKDGRNLPRVEPAHDALLAEIRRRLQATRDDRNVTNEDGSNYWGPRVTQAINRREHDGPALVQYIKDVLRRRAVGSQGWSALQGGDRLDISFEDMVLNAAEPIRSVF